MEKYKLKDFAKWTKKEGLSDKDLNKVLGEMSAGLLGDRLGAYVYKKRVGVSGKGKRGGVRVIIIFKQKELAVFLYGYSKKEKSDLELREEEALRIFAKDFIGLSPAEKKQYVADGNLILIEGGEL